MKGRAKGTEKKDRKERERKNERERETETFHQMFMPQMTTAARSGS